MGDTRTHPGDDQELRRALFEYDIAFKAWCLTQKSEALERVIERTMDLWAAIEAWHQREAVKEIKAAFPEVFGGEQGKEAA